ncbi:hypothetical protein MIR68_012505 [Amoeboaphelidium protococcarum]|nr:hypothetical protein MIR68_012505 [Amoeboaphelidium protococcarum]
MMIKTVFILDQSQVANLKEEDDIQSLILFSWVNNDAELAPLRDQQQYGIFVGTVITLLNWNCQSTQELKVDQTHSSSKISKYNEYPLADFELSNGDIIQCRGVESWRGIAVITVGNNRHLGEMVALRLARLVYQIDCDTQWESQKDFINRAMNAVIDDTTSTPPDDQSLDVLPSLPFVRFPLVSQSRSQYLLYKLSTLVLSSGIEFYVFMWRDGVTKSNMLEQDLYYMLPLFRTVVPGNEDHQSQAGSVVLKIDQKMYKVLKRVKDDISIILLAQQMDESFQIQDECLARLSQVCVNNNFCVQLRPCVSALQTLRDQDAILSKCL